VICNRCTLDLDPVCFRRGKICQECERLDQNSRKEARYAKGAEIQRRKKAERHAAVDVIKSVPCADCQIAWPPYVMDLDHRDPAQKLFEVSRAINKTNTPWSRVLEEISKCDVVCVRCHRLRTWKPGSPWIDNRRKLIIELKDVPCADCQGRFHYCQMDFDHVRGVKLGQVIQMKSRATILEEAAKCEVVCANCHRERTQKAQPTPRVTPLEMRWSRQHEGTLQSSFTPPTTRETPIFRPWHSLVGTVTDVDLSKQFGVSRAAISLYRKKWGAPKFLKHLSTAQIETKKDT